MSKETKARTRNAVRAMKAIGISEDKVKPVLKSLVRLFDKNWALIEEENYRALADAIFETEEEAEKQSKKIVNNETLEQSENDMNTHTEDHMEEEAQATEEPEPPLKRLRPRQQDGQTSSTKPSTSVTPLVRRKEEPDKLPDTNLTKLNGLQGIVGSTQANKGKQPMSPKPICDPCQPSCIGRSQQSTLSRMESRSNSHPMRLRDRGTGAASSQIASREKRPVPESPADNERIKEPMLEPGIPIHAFVKPKDEPTTDEMPSLEVPGAINHPDISNGGDPSSSHGMPRENYSPEQSALQSVSEEETSEGNTIPSESRSNNKMAAVSGGFSSSLEIASTSSGEVKIYLTCDLARGGSDFHMPSLDAVLKSVEEKCLRPAKTLGHDISMMNLMEEMCQCFLKLGTDPPRQSPKTMTVSVPKSKTPVVSPPCNGIHNGPKEKEMDGGDEIEKNGENEENSAEEVNGRSSEAAKPPHDVVDIAKGQEKVVITLVNEVNDESPPSFRYIPQNAAFQNAYVNFSLARIGDNNSCAACSGDCLSLSTPCACSFETGGEFAYTTDGLVREELLKESISMNRNPKKHCQYYCKECPLERSKGEASIESCKGHLVRKFIKECWWKCGCDKQCGNRVVQRGITRKLQVFMTPGGKGWGLRTLEDMPRGAFVCEYVGEVLTNAELFERVSRSPEGEKHSYPVLLDADWCAEGVLKDEEALCLDATYYGNVARFINHRCYDSTLVEIPVEVETPDHHYYHLAFFTTRKVKAMEELTWDYGIDFDDHEHPIKAFRCNCGSKSCRMKRSRSRARRW